MSDLLTRRKPVLVALVTLVTFLLILNVRFGLRPFAFYRDLAMMDVWYATIAWKFAQIPLTILALVAFYRIYIGDALRELGLRGQAMLGLGLSFLLTLPALVMLAVVGTVNENLTASRLITTGIASPLSEEILFRSYLFRQLYRRANWPFLAAALASAVPFALGHIFQTANVLDLVGYTAVMAAMAVFTAWLFVRWDENLWFLIGFHAFINAWWALFAADTPLYGWVSNALRVVTVLLFVLATVYRDRLGTVALRWRTRAQE